MILIAEMPHDQSEPLALGDQGDQVSKHAGIAAFFPIVLFSERLVRRRHIRYVFPKCQCRLLRKLFFLLLSYLFELACLIAGAQMSRMVLTLFVSAFARR